MCVCVCACACACAYVWLVKVNILVKLQRSLLSTVYWSKMGLCIRKPGIGLFFCIQKKVRFSTEKSYIIFIKVYFSEYYRILPG